MPTKVCLVKAMVFPVVRCGFELYYKENWAPENWCFWTVVLEKTLESPLGCKEIQPVHPKGDQSWLFTGRTEVEAETWILWLPDVESWLTGKDPDAEKDWRQEEKGTKEGEMVGRHHRLNGHGFGWTLGVGDGQGGLVCCGSWVCKESDMSEGLNWTDSWHSRNLPGWFFSVARGIQAVRRLPCLRSFFIASHVRHLSGPVAGVLLKALNPPSPSA